MADTITHLAGPVVVIANRGIQRCAVCGAKLCDSKGQMGVIGPNGEEPQAAFWKEKALVQVAAGNPTRSSVVGELDDPEPLPGDFCEQWE